MAKSKSPERERLHGNNSCKNINAFEQVKDYRYSSSLVKDIKDYANMGSSEFKKQFEVKI